MNIYKIKYPTREDGISDLFIKGIISEDLKWDFPTHAIVDLQEGHFDIMTENEYDFGINLINPVTPNHQFGGWEVKAIEDVPEDSE